MVDDESLSRIPGRFWPHLICGAIIGLMTAYAVAAPEYNWDVVGYSGAALQPEYTSGAELHRAAFSRLRATLPDPQFHEVAPEGDDYRSIVASDPHSFVQQLPFYSSKPLYVALIRLVSMAGVDVVRAPGAVSAAAAAGILLVVYLWIGRYCAGFVRIMCTLGGGVVLGIPAAARLASPDALSALIVISSVFLAVGKGRPRVGALLLPLSVFARPDNLIVALFLSAAFLFILKGEPRNGISLAAAYMVSLVLIYFVVTRVWPSYGNQLLFYHTFVAKLAYPAAAVVSVTPENYSKALLGGMKMSIFSPFNIPLWILSLSAAFVMSLRKRPLVVSREMVLLVWSCVAAGSVHFLLFPVADGRFYLAEGVVAAILCLGAVRPLRMDAG